MMLTEGLGPAFVSLTGGTLAHFSPGQVFRAVVQLEDGGLFLSLAGQRISLGGDTALQPGQSVQVEVVLGGESLRLRVVPQRSAAPQTPAIQAPRIFADLLEGLGLLERAADLFPQMPPGLSEQPGGLGAWLGLLASPEALAEDLQQVILLLGQASEAGAVSPEFLAEFTALVAQFGGAESGELKRLLMELSANRGVAAQLAKAIEKGAVDEVLDALQAQLRVKIGQLRGQEALLDYLQAKGQLGRFEHTLERLLERLSAGDIQNLHSARQAYQFLEIPVTPDTGFRWIQIHFFGDRSKGKQRAFTEQASVVLDCSTHHLGGLWVTLHTASGRCQCHFRATEPAVADAIEEDAASLKAALARAGYPGATVTASLWDGDRIGECARFFQPGRGIDLNA